MRRTDESIKRLNSVKPALDEDFTIADKYPEEEKEPALEPIDAPALIVENQRRLSIRGFAHPLSSRKRRELRRDLAGRPERIPPPKDTTARDLTAISQQMKTMIMPRFFSGPMRDERPPFIQTLFGARKILRPISEETGIPGRVRISVPIGDLGSGIIEAEKASRTNWLDRFFIWINRLLERKK